MAAKVSLDQDGSPRGTKDEDLPKGEPVTLFRSLRDGPRAVDQLLLAPRYWSTAHDCFHIPVAIVICVPGLNSAHHVTCSGVSRACLLDKPKQCVLFWLCHLMCMSQIT